jgi:hypothetical protein
MTSFKDGDFIALQADTGKFWSKNDRETGSGLAHAIDAVGDGAPRSPSEFTVWVIDSDTVALRGDNGLFVSRIARERPNGIEAEKTTIDAYCLFKVEKLGSGQIALKAENGRYLSRINVGSLEPIEAEAKTAEPHSPSAFKVFHALRTLDPPVLGLHDGDMIGLQADAGKHWRWIDRELRGHPAKPVEAEADSARLGATSAFHLEVYGKKLIGLRADNGLYVSRIAREGNDYGIEAAAKTAVGPSRFEISYKGDGRITLKADNGNFLSRINRDGINPIEARFKDDGVGPAQHTVVAPLA